MSNINSQMNINIKQTNESIYFQKIFENLKLSEISSIYNPKNINNKKFLNFCNKFIDIQKNNIQLIDSPSIRNKEKYRNIYYNINHIKTLYEDDFSSKQYVSIEVDNYIIKNITKSFIVSYKISLKNIPLIVNFIIFPDICLSLSKLDEYIDYIINIILTINSLGGDYNKLFNKKSLKINLYLTPFKKEYNNTENLSPDNLNTGYTNVFTENCKIVIYRFEEFLKVLTHECIHSIGIDKNLILMEEEKTNNINNIITKNLNLNLKNGFNLSLNESICEFWTNIIFIGIYTLKIQNKNNKKLYSNISLFYKYFLKNLQNQTYFSFFQYIKIFINKNIDLLTFNENRIDYKEKSHFLSYFFIKSVFLYNFNIFFNNSDFITSSSDFQLPIDIIKNNNFLDTIDNKINEENFINLYKKLRDTIELLKKKSDSYHFLVNNLYMCLFEIN